MGVTPRDDNLRLVFSEIESGYIQEEIQVFKILVYTSIVLLAVSLAYIAFTGSKYAWKSELVTMDCNVDCSGNAHAIPEEEKEEALFRILRQEKLLVVAFFVAPLSIFGLISCFFRLLWLKRQEEIQQAFLRKYKRVQAEPDQPLAKSS
ncbi:MAG: hypothetical protein OQJ97_05355 [Rhodospirillales bacterium]|nr:hypothetical protein [Rhodospirillales bacterium]